MIELIGVDLVLEHHPEEAGLRRALSVCLGIAGERIAIIADVADHSPRDPADLVCTRHRFPGGEFVDKLSLDGQVTRAHDSTLAALECLCEALAMRCLTPVEGANPYAFWLIAPGQPTRRVDVDVRAYDDEDRFVLARHSRR